MSPTAFGALYSESFESGTLSGWNAGTLNGSTTTVNTDLASQGIYGTMNTFTVPSTFAGYTVVNILDRDARSFLDSETATISADVYSNWANPQGWGVYDNSIKLVLNYEGGYQVLNATSGSLVNGSFTSLSWDLTPWAATITNSGLSYSSIGFSWKLGTYADNGTENGTQTLAIDNIQAVPECGAFALLGLGGIGFLGFRRRAAC
ncbi:MAG: hypothetical protein ABIT37_11995 [Luteolibacter sp.]